MLKNVVIKLHSYILFVQKADFFAHIFANTNRRDEILDFSYLLPQKEMLTIFSYPRARVSESPWNIFSSFSSQIWALITFFFLIYGALNWYSYKQKVFKTKLLDLSSSYTDMFALMLGQGILNKCFLLKINYCFLCVCRNCPIVQ